MKAKQRLDKVLEATKQRVQEEVGSLLGADFHLSDVSTRVVSKSDFFDEQTGKKVVAKVDINGEIEGIGGIVLGVKDAIRLGGTLIMLPSGELDEVSKSENYTEEIEDSYGEIANIIAGAYTKAFEDSFPKDCRFIRKEQDVVVPKKVDIGSAEPFPDQNYYLASSDMTLDGHEMSQLSVLIPAVPFGIEVPNNEGQGAESKAELKEQEPTSLNEEKNSTSSEETTVVVEKESQEDTIVNEERTDTATSLTGKELEKHKKLIDQLLVSCRNTIGEEVGALLGVTVKLGDNTNKLVNKEDFFQEEISGKHVLADMDIVGDLEGRGFLFVTLKDAIRIGSTLIMLPPNELETAVNEEEFTEDAKDAYGEIANIISGAYTTIFQEQYTQSIRFIKKEIETVSPLKVDCESDDLIPAQLYYLSSSSLEINGKEYGAVNLLLPAPLLGIDRLGVDEIADGAEEKSPAHISQSETTAPSSSTSKSTDGYESDSGIAQVDENAEILIIENNSAEAEKIKKEIESIGISSQKISFNDSINSHLTNGLKLVIIVMQEVDEQAYGIAIKLRAMKTIPIVAAGSGWTRSKVIKAVKYGVTDILLTPSGSDDIREKINDNMLKMAA